MSALETPQRHGRDDAAFGLPAFDVAEDGQLAIGVPGEQMPLDGLARVPADEVRAGDAIVFLGRPYLVERVDPYLGPFEHVFGVARSGPYWAMSLESGVELDVIRCAR